MPRIVQRMFEGADQADGQEAMVHKNPLLNRLYRNRGIACEQDLDCDLRGLLPPSLMKGMDKAVDLLADCVVNGKRAVYVSDYDCDGATACAIGVEGLRLLGAADVRFIVPNRFEYGYGLSPAIVALAAEQKPDVIITVDNGITSFEGAEAVKALPFPCKLLITDHHLAPAVGLPEADAIVNPNQPGCPFPSKAIAGCGVMFYVLLALRARLREIGWFNETRKEPNLGVLLDLLALGTVADVVPLDKNNRILVRHGLNLINSGRGRPGIRHLLELGKRRIGRVVASDLAFAAGPRLNSAGRLSDMTLGVACLLEKDDEQALTLATTLDRLNIERREIEQEMKEEALVELEEIGCDAHRFGLCLHQASWHQGVIGIVASRIKEKFFRPVICFASDGDEYLKGSARSVKGFHLKHALDAVAARHPGILIKFGGHAMAAGMTIRQADFETFSQAFDEEVRRYLTAEDVLGSIETDGELEPDDISLDNAALIREGGPWGQNFVEPLFHGTFRIVNKRVLGDKHLKMTVMHPEGGVAMDAIAFNCVENGAPPVEDQALMTYRMDINEWRGKTTLQLVVDYLEPA